MNRQATHSPRPVIAVVGAGSIAWGRLILIDMMANQDLADAEFRLIDILPDRLAMVQEWLEFAKLAKGWTHPISVHTDLREGLRGATACLTAIAVGGDRLWRYDSTHPQLDGIFQPVGDSTGPGGAVRALRHAPALQAIAGTLAEVGSPTPVLIQLTNPLNALTSVLDTIPGLRVFGFCHGYDDTEAIISRTLGSFRNGGGDCKVELAGNNHFVFVDKLTVGHETYDQQSLARLTPEIFDCPFREAVWSRYGVFVGNYARHPIEFLPDFVTQKWHFGRDWGVLPVAEQIDPERGERHDKTRQTLETDLAAARVSLAATATWPLTHSREPIAEILAAFHTGKRFDTHLNLRNRGAIAGISPDHHVEMFCRIEGGEVHRPSVHFPERITMEIERIGASQQLLASCCRDYDEELLVEAMMLDALMPKNKDSIRRLMREMIHFQKDFIFPPKEPSRNQSG